MLNGKLCACSAVNVGEVILMISLLGMRHDLTWVAIIDIIKLVNCLFKEEVLNVSKYKLINLFLKNRNAIKYNIYCRACKKNIDTVSNLKERKKYTCSICKLDYTQGKKSLIT